MKLTPIRKICIPALIKIV